MPFDECPDCGGERVNGLCPRCLLKLGIDEQGQPPGKAGGTLDLSPGPGSALEAFNATSGIVPHVLLREPAFAEEPTPIIRPSNGNETSTRYRIDGEIARGGMGAILMGRDCELGRDVAIKVLREDHRGNDDMARRFVEEAQIGGQLQHPGVVPIYELGTFADHRPFFSMKLVKGKTLADLLVARPTPADDLPRFLSIFEAIAQTMAYAHARGVIHRDLKPSNVMVGSFGEVQVMDWGLAKVLPHGWIAADARAGKESLESAIATARSGSDEDLSHPGTIMGTPSYMAPEQARGEIDRIDERADVFALGSILGEILTDRPAFVGRTSGEIERKASRGDTADALVRLDACGAEAELIALAKDCLAAEPEARPSDAGRVADRITSYLAGVQARVQSAERERAVAVATAIEERRRRKVQLALAASVLAFTTLAGLYAQQRQARAAARDKVIARATMLRDQALTLPEDQSRWQVALAAVEQAEAVGDASARERLLRLHAEVQVGLDAARRDQTLLNLLVDIRSAAADDQDGGERDLAYAETFLEAGLDFSTLPPAELGARIKARPPSVALAMASALDDWASLRRGLAKDPGDAGRLTEAARVADPDPWRDELRSALAIGDKGHRKGALKALVDTARFDEFGAVSLALLGKALADSGELATAETVLRRAQLRHSGDVWVNYHLAEVLEQLNRRDEAIRFYTAARAVRPDTAHELAHALIKRGESDEGIEVFRDLTRLRPGNGRHLACLGSELQSRGRSKEAAAVLEQAVAALSERTRLKPGNASAHSNLGFALYSQGKYNEAVAECREAIRIRPDFPVPYYNLGNALAKLGKLDDAAAAYLEEIRLRPDQAEAHGNLGNVLQAQGKLDLAVAEYREGIRLKPDFPNSHNNLGLALQAQGKLDLAVAEFREAIRLKPDFPNSHNGLGIALRAQGKLDLAVAEFREAIRLKPDFAEAHNNLGIALREQGKLDLAAVEFREAIRLKPDNPEAHDSLGNVLIAQGKLDQAAVEFREAIRLKPDYTLARYNLGNVLYTQGKLDLAVAEFREAIRLKPDFPNSHNNLGLALNAQGKFDLAAVEVREAIRLKPDHAGAHTNLGFALRGQGDYAGSLAMFRRGHELGTKQPGWRFPSAQWVVDAERLAALADRVPALLKGEDGPKDVPERLALAQICYDKKFHAAAARFWAEALEADPKLGDNRQIQHRYNAACSAALAAAGQGKDDPAPDAAAKAKLRGQALDWLKAELVTWGKVLDSAPVQMKARIAPTLQHWKADADLAAIRDPEGLARLPEPERKEWQALWSEVEALLQRAQGKTP